jgi:hypothetical protein
MGADAGRPMLDEIEATPQIAYHRFDAHTRQVSLRNTGVNTLWLSFDRERWFDVASGTSWDDRVNILGLYFCTQTGRTYFVVIGIQLCAPVPRLEA